MVVNEQTEQRTRKMDRTWLAILAGAILVGGMFMQAGTAEGAVPIRGMQVLYQAGHLSPEVIAPVALPGNKCIVKITACGFENPTTHLYYSPTIVWDGQESEKTVGSTNSDHVCEVHDVLSVINTDGGEPHRVQAKDTYVSYLALAYECST